MYEAVFASVAYALLCKVNYGYHKICHVFGSQMQHISAVKFSMDSEK